MRTNEEVFYGIVKEMKQKYPGIGDESGELDWETIVSDIIVKLGKELIDNNENNNAI